MFGDNKARFESFVQKGEGGCWLWIGSTNHHGYGRLRWRGTTMQAHRVAWEIANGREVPRGAMVLHSCDVRACVRYDHLFLGVAADNTQDMISKGRAWFSSRDGLRWEICRRYAAGETQVSIAAATGVSQACVSRLVRKLGVISGDLASLPRAAPSP